MSGERDLGSTRTNNSSSSRQEFIADLKAIRAKGKAANLTEEQIDDLFFRSPWIEELSPVRTLMRNSFKLMTKCTYVLTVILCLLICVNQLDILAPYVSEFASAYEFPIVRISRKFLMYSGLHKVLAEYDFASAPCILDNPLFAAPTPPCVSDCYDAAFAEYSAEDASTLRNYSYREMTHLFVYRGASSPSSFSSFSSVSLSDIQRVLRPHADEVVKRARIFYSNVKDFFTLEDFLSSHDAEKLLDDDDDDDKDDFNDALVSFGSTHYNTSRHFRSLFPRAPFVPREAEVYLEKKLFAYRPGRKFRLLTRDWKLGHNWIYQARGSYCFTIRQRDECPPQEKQDRIRQRVEETGDAAATTEAETAAVEELKAAVEAEPAAQESEVEEDLQFEEISEEENAVFEGTQKW